MPRTERGCGLAILAKAPIPGFAKTRLMPHLGREEAARLQEALVRRTVAVGLASGLTPLTLWAAPDAAHPLFAELAQSGAVRLAAQIEGDLGARMQAAFAEAAGPLVLIGTDCPPLAPAHLSWAAAAIGAPPAPGAAVPADGATPPADVAMIPAEDGGYVLIAARAVHAPLFKAMPWGGAEVAAATRARAAAAGLSLAEHPPLWDLDRLEDLKRLAGIAGFAAWAAASGCGPMEVGSAPAPVLLDDPERTERLCRKSTDGAVTPISRQRETR